MVITSSITGSNNKATYSWTVLKTKSRSASYVESNKRALESKEGLIKLGNEQRNQEDESESRLAALEIAKQKSEEARKFAALNEAKVESAVETKLRRLETDVNTISSIIPNTINMPLSCQEQKTFPIKLKGVEPPKFTGKIRTKKLIMIHEKRHLQLL